MRLLVRVQTKPQALWQYMGQYDSQPSDPFSRRMDNAARTGTPTPPFYPPCTVADLFKVKEEWADNMRKGGWGKGVRVRVKSRKHKGRGELSTPDLKEVTTAAFEKHLTRARR